MGNNLIVVLAVFIHCTILVGCDNPNGELKRGALSRPASNDLQGSGPIVQLDYISGTWSWVTSAIPTVLTKQIATIKCSGDSVTGQIIWLLDEKYFADISNGKTDGSKISFDATFVQPDVKVKFSYVGSLEDTGTRILGTFTISGTEAGKAVMRENVWNAVPEH